MTGETILVIEDDPEIRELISIYLQQNGFLVITASDERAIEAAKTKPPDLIILDVVLPSADGFEICQALRKITDVPILFLSGKTEDTDKIYGLTLGADDYIEKPFSPGELMARVHAHLRRNRMLRTAHNRHSIIHYHGLEVDEESFVVRVRGEIVTLSAKEFQLLVFFLKNPGKVFRPEQLFYTLWNSPCLDDVRTVSVHISNLRKKIEENPSKPQYILTIRGVGYKLNDAFSHANEVN